MIRFRIIYFLVGLTLMLPFAVFACWAISAQADAALAKLHFTTPGSAAVEPFVRWVLQNRYESATGSVLTGALSIAWLYSKTQARKIERTLDRLDRPHRRRRKGW